MILSSLLLSFKNGFFDGSKAGIIERVNDQ